MHPAAALVLSHAGCQLASRCSRDCPGQYLCRKLWLGAGLLQQKQTGPHLPLPYLLPVCACQGPQICSAGQRGAACCTAAPQRPYSAPAACGCAPGSPANRRYYLCSLLKAALCQPTLQAALCQPTLPAWRLLLEFSHSSSVCQVCLVPPQGSLQGGSGAAGGAGSGGGRDDVEAGAASEQCAPAPPAPALGPAPGRPPWQEPALRQRAARRGLQGPPDMAARGAASEAAQVCQEAEAEAGARGRLGELAGRAGRWACLHKQEYIARLLSDWVSFRL